MARRGPRHALAHPQQQRRDPLAGTDAEEARGVAIDAVRRILARSTASSRRFDRRGRVTSSGLAGIQQSHQEAKQALALGTAARRGRTLTRFEDLGVYRLIFAAEASARNARRSTMRRSGQLIEYDRAHGGELIRTLKAFCLVDDDLGDAMTVTDVQEDQLAVVAASVDPAGQARLDARIGRAQMTGSVRAVGRGETGGSVRHGRQMVRDRATVAPVTPADERCRDQSLVRRALAVRGGGTRRRGSWRRRRSRRPSSGPR